MDPATAITARANVRSARAPVAMAVNSVQSITTICGIPLMVMHAEDGVSKMSALSSKLPARGQYAQERLPGRAPQKEDRLLSRGDSGEPADGFDAAHHRGRCRHGVGDLSALADDPQRLGRGRAVGRERL